MNKKVLYAFVAATALGSGYVDLETIVSTPAYAAKAEKAIPVEAAEVKTGTLTRRITSVGQLVSMQTVVLKPQVSGTIAKILFQDGQNVKQGESLFKVNDLQYRSKLKEAQAKVTLSTSKHNRTLELQKKKFGTPAAVEEALATLEINEAEKELAQQQLNQTEVKAPFEGVIGFSKVSVGATVSADQTELAMLVDLDPMQIEFQVPETQLAKIKTGAEVDVTVDGFDALPFAARISAIDPSIDPQTHGVLVRAVVANESGKLKPGLFARVNIVLGEESNVVVVPETAIEKSGDEEYVFIVVDNVAVKKIVSTGMVDEGKIEIIDGVKLGDHVVTSGQFKLSDGKPVMIVTDKAGS